MALHPPGSTLPRGVGPTTVTPTTPNARNPVGDPNSLDPEQRARFVRTIVDDIKAGGEFGMSPFEPGIAGHLTEGVRAGYISACELNELRSTYVRNNVQRVLADMRDGLTNMRDEHTRQVLGFALKNGMLPRRDFEEAVDANKAGQKRSMEEIRRILRNP